jgi:hypothetical protein
MSKTVEKLIFEFAKSVKEIYKSHGAQSIDTHHFYQTFLKWDEVDATNYSYSKFRQLFGVFNKVFGIIEYSTKAKKWQLINPDSLLDKDVTKLAEDTDVFGNVLLSAFGVASKAAVKEVSEEIIRNEIKAMLEQIVSDEFREKVNPAICQNLQELFDSSKTELMEVLNGMVDSKIKEKFATFAKSI